MVRSAIEQASVVIPMKTESILFSMSRVTWIPACAGMRALFTLCSSCEESLSTFYKRTNIIEGRYYMFLVAGH